MELWAYVIQIIMERSNMSTIPGEPEQLIDLIELLIEKFKPMKIYCFGKIAESVSTTGCFHPDHSQNTCHYFLLMVMESPTRNEHEAQDFCNTKFTSGKITILSHGMETIDNCVAKNNRFFISVLNQAQQLYSANGIVNLSPKFPFDPSQTLEKAKKHYSHRITLAIGFLEGAEACFKNKHFAVSLFMIHQVIEQCTIALVRVNLAYRSDIHHLGRQLDLCSCFSPLPSEVFRNTKEDIRLFNILLKSYSHARYHDSFNVEQDDADKLLSRAYAFLELTKVLCEAKIAEFEAVEYRLTESEVCFE
ncbi:HEPN domain-containing protein [Pedobacter sp. UYEF25]